MAVDYSYLFQTPSGQVNPMDVDLDATFADVNAQARLNELERSNKINGLITSGLGAINGITGMVATGQQLRDVQETPWFDVQLDSLQGLGSRDYSDNASLANAMAQANYGVRQNYQDVRGLTKGQEAGLIGSSALSGAAAGHAIGKNFGVWGDIIGTGIGAIGGTISGFVNRDAGRRAARIQTDFDNAQVGIAQYNAGSTFRSEGEEIADFNNRSHIGHVVKNGGKIEREQETLEHFAERVLGKKSSILPQRVLCKGGVRVKIKR